MKLLLICTSVEPGRDAVGDYTVAFSNALSKSGVMCNIVAVADSYVVSSSEEVREGCRVLRLPKSSSWNERWEALSLYVKAVNPDWISLQWVAFGYHDKGLPLNLGRRLRETIGELPVHVMCHEIWIKADGTGTLKERLYSRLQRAVHRRVFRDLRPSCVHTHAEPYRKALGSIDIKSNILPLASNIHGHGNHAFKVIADEAIQASNNELRFIVFGNTPPEWNASEVIQIVGLACQRMNKKARLWLLGKGGMDEQTLQSVVESGNEVGVTVESLGFLETDSALSYMCQADVGLATVPFALWQKSSAVATMRSCGLPVVFSRFDGDWSDDCLPHWEDGFFRLEEDAIVEVANRKKSDGVDMWQEAARRFLHTVDTPADTV
ncbi:MAG TPA: hypothetical protein DCX06_03515 [Opitutae bacterium]|nr:hypothetical protein [Opitutae bacterium]